jgi:hypothetical protein
MVLLHNLTPRQPGDNVERTLCKTVALSVCVTQSFKRWQKPEKVPSVFLKLNFFGPISLGNDGGLQLMFLNLFDLGSKSRDAL